MSNIIRCFPIFLTLCLCMTCVGQDELERARHYPPELLKSDNTKISFAVIDWKIEQLEALHDSYRRSRDEIEARIDHSSDKAKALAQKLPRELRFMDKETRSRLAGKLMETLLDAKLELATRSKEIETAKSRMDDQIISTEQKSNLAISQIAIEAAKKKVQVSQIEFSKSERLKNSGSRSEPEFAMARYTIELARLELDKAMKEHEILANSPKSKLAEQLAEKSISIEPLKARIAAAEKFLVMFSDSADVVSEIDSYNRQNELYEKDREFAATELIRISRESGELRMLRKRIVARLEAAEEKVEPKKE